MDYVLSRKPVTSEYTCSATSSKLEAVAADAVVNDKRFNSFLTADEAEMIAVGYVPKNTENTTKWVIRNFHEGWEVRNSIFPNDPCQYPVICLLHVI
jgi:hypothetical protein